MNKEIRARSQYTFEPRCVLKMMRMWPGGTGRF